MYAVGSVSITHQSIPCAILSLHALSLPLSA
jgi:hypothetical protein